jgi:effector-binding domain-containing protein
MESSLPACDRLLVAEHDGPYEELGLAWMSVGKWMGANHLKGSGVFWERSIIGPESGAEPATFKTQLQMPIV